MLDHDSAWVNGRGGELRVNIFANIDVSTDLLEDDTMAARIRVFEGSLLRGLGLGWLRVQLWDRRALWVVMSVSMAVVLMAVGISVVLMEVRISWAM